MLRVLLIDDHPVVRQGVRQILSDRLPGVYIGEAENAKHGLSEIRTGYWDVVILDLTMPDASGLIVLKQARVERPDLRIIMLSIHSAKQFARLAIAAGASAYVTKDAVPTDLIEAVLAVHEGREYVSGDVAPAASAARPEDLLSDREYQVLRMLGSGMQATQIANALRLSVKTVSTYRSRLLVKLGLTTTAELMRYAIENGLIDT